ncbi:unnamed protein product [Dibothriocephalus latus]|uniref:Ionotropic glutamate receptor C-terminal domain-containing protein n=1 Tax=Dibothriocephalus latus TaxID=60516 RepID=A0A3P6SRA6_DIBLA|nr:unnamed protein product [Dibothriocephalus latus]
MGHSQSSVSNSMLEAIFGSSPNYVYTYQATQVSQNGNLEAQFLKDMTAQDYTISAFPLMHAKNAPLNLQQTSSVLLDSVVIVGMAFPTDYRPFELFAPFDGYVWLLILISLIVIAAIFLVIQEVSERQRRNLGVEGTVEETSHFSQIRDAIFRNFSAILLAKLNLRPKMPSIRVLYQFYWFNALIMVVTFAAMLAARRLIMPTTGVFFNSLTDLLDNKAGVRWFFLQNSSVHALARLSPVENLFDMNFYMYGPSNFINFVQQRIDALNSEGFFGRINNQLTAPGQCPQEDERSELRATPFTLSDMSGLFFVLLAGLLLAILVELIGMVREKCTLYRQRAENKLEFGEEYKAEVVNVAVVLSQNLTGN